MSRAIAILLTVAIIACPLLCAVGECCAHPGGKDRAQGCSCCHENGGANLAGHHSGPTAPQPAKSGQTRQCICGGALVDDAGLQLVHFDWSWSLPVAVVEPIFAQLNDVFSRQISVAAWPDVGMNHGRALCCLYNTYLC